MAVAFLPGSSRLASGSSDHTVRVWDLEAGAVRGLPQPATLRVGGGGGSDQPPTRLFRTAPLEAGTEVAALTGHERFVTSLSPSPNGKMLAPRLPSAPALEHRAEVERLVHIGFCAWVCREEDVGATFRGEVGASEVWCIQPGAPDGGWQNVV